MRIISWNIQWGRGADGKVDLSRTIAALRTLGPADLICLQEVTQGIPSLSGRPEDEVAAIAQSFPGFEAVFAAAIDVQGESGGRARFGNLVLSALPVLQVLRHALPFPVEDKVLSMPRCCLELVIRSKRGPLRVLTTHLEYHSGVQRRAQLAALRRLQEEAAAYGGQTPRGKKQGHPVFAPRPRPTEAVLCGDFNMSPTSPEYAVMAKTPTPDGSGWVDVWRVVHGETPHAASANLHDTSGPGRASCRDYFWVSENLVSRVQDLWVDTKTLASDHQPIVLDIDF